MDVGGTKKASIKYRDNQPLLATDKCLATTPNMKVRALENTYEMLCESKMMYGVELRGFSEAWKEIGNIHGRFFDEVLGLPRCTANGVTELGRDSTREKDYVVGSQVMENDNAYGYSRLWHCCGWQRSDMRFES